ncbi:hypothetical protein AJ79_03999 [Helicocarpus griseus UAMH5409]|uniref:Uncharacterized protein n=1 Tax=Helicocarpus griseus UAMH5409 TaxID=1447875 RepID=A0A2B7XVA1_9EURO|nr:hypothetical protein AJ79_03999 [Helicocarpus griseus UAMH5409]
MAQQFTPHDDDSATLEISPIADPLFSIQARYEYETGNKGIAGTKILMVEWVDDDPAKAPGTWHISWEGKQLVFPADEKTSDNTRRCYFLLAPGIGVPPSVTLAYHPPPSSAAAVKGPESVQVAPLPAIYTKELGATPMAACKKGVLHTKWAKKRLQVLEKEIEKESRNPEGVAFHMAVMERDWIQSDFGIGPRPAPLQTISVPPMNSVPLTPTTPLSPGGGRKLSEKLKGLKLGTSEKDLTRKPQAANQAGGTNSHLLSPEDADVAVSSFNSFTNNITPVSAQAKPGSLQTVALQPPASIQVQQQQQQSQGGFTSLNQTDDDGTEDGLFAKALSPRSPDIPRSPFSFSPEETILYAKKKINES